MMMLYWLYWQSVMSNKKMTNKSYHEKLLNIEFEWNGNSLSQADTVSDVPHLIDKLLSESHSVS